MQKIFLVIGAVVSLGTVASLYGLANRAVETDYQATFFQGLAIGVIGALIAALCFHVAAWKSGRKRLVPGIVALGLLTAVALLRFDGFSGEMIPQLAWRWTAKVAPPPMKTTVASVPTVSVGASVDGTSADGGDTEATIAMSTDGLSANQSLGFLGNHRNGIYTDAFVLPASDQPLRQAWAVGVGSGWSSFSVANGLAITIEERSNGEADGSGSSEWITAYDLTSGDLRWKHTYPAQHFNSLGGGGPRSTPQIDGDAVYVQGATGMVTCLSLNEGRVRWSVDLMGVAGWSKEESEKKILWGRSGSPLIVDSLCVVPFGASETGDYAENRGLIAFDKRDGRVVWTAGSDQISYASPQLIEFSNAEGEPVRQIVIVNERTISGHTVTDGATLWTTEWEGDSAGGANCASVVAAGDNRFLIGKGYGGGSALFRVAAVSDGWEVEDVWTSSRVMKTKFNHAVVVGDVAYGISNGALEAIDVSKAKRLWLQPRGKRCGQGQVIMAGETLIVQNEDGSLTFVAADPSQYRELRRIEAMHSKTWNIPTLAGNYLLVRNSQTAICFELGSRSSGE